MRHKCSEASCTEGSISVHAVQPLPHDVWLTLIALICDQQVNATLVLEQCVEVVVSVGVEQMAVYQCELFSRSAAAWMVGAAEVILRAAAVCGKGQLHLLLRVPKQLVAKTTQVPRYVQQRCNQRN